MNRAISAIILALTVSGCSFTAAPEQNSALMKELAAAGRVEVSPDNPYIASNLYLSREADRSETLRGFLEHRGNPNELELSLDESNEPNARFFYHDSSQAYTLHKRSGEWIILSADNMAPASPQAVAQVESLPPPVMKKEMLARSLPVEKPKARMKPAAKAPQAFTLEASGDVIHRVTYPGETLRLIVSWYTGDMENLDRIIRINSIDHPNMLKLGQNVRIPRYLLTNPTPLTERDVEQYRRGKF